MCSAHTATSTPWGIVCLGLEAMATHGFTPMRSDWMESIQENNVDLARNDAMEAAQFCKNAESHGYPRLSNNVVRLDGNYTRKQCGPSSEGCNEGCADLYLLLKSRAAPLRDKLSLRRFVQ